MKDTECVPCGKASLHIISLYNHKKIIVQRNPIHVSIIGNLCTLPITIIFEDLRTLIERVLTEICGMIFSQHTLNYIGYWREYIGQVTTISSSITMLLFCSPMQTHVHKSLRNSLIRKPNFIVTHFSFT